jgi:hypothetical protein
MPKASSILYSTLVVLLSFVGAVHAQQRPLLYPNSLSGPIQELAKTIRDPHSNKVPLNQLPPANRYFIRIAPRAAILTKDNKLQATSVLAAPAKPFVFLTTPESIFGRSLLEIYEDIGYEAEDIIRSSRNEDMVAILFRYPNDVSVSRLTDGKLPNNWSKWIYPTTWDNLFSLFSELVQDDRSELCNKVDVPVKRICLPNIQASFVLGFPAEGKLRLKTTTYSVLKAVGGSDWEYRKLLETRLSVFEHFRGNGETQNEVFDPDAQQPGLLELIGPNMKINELPEVAIIHLGKLVMEDCYSASSKDGPKCGMLPITH